jgi:TPR repeat protein
MEGMGGVTQDSPAGLALYQKAADQGYLTAQFGLGYVYSRGYPGVPKDKALSDEWYGKFLTVVRREAENGAAEYQNTLGDLYETGLGGVERDNKESFRWTKMAADQGYAAAEYSIGRYYRSGIGVEADDKTAFEWMQKSALQGNADAEEMLAQFFQGGIGTSKDANAAVEWHKKAADHGEAYANGYVAEAYAQGEGVPRDDAQAEEWIDKAIKAGNIIGLERIGEVYRDQDDFPHAERWWNVSANYGDPVSQYQLCWLYSEQHGAVPEDLGKAYLWCSLAAKNGDPSAGEMRDRLAPRISARERAVQDERAARWKPYPLLTQSH